MSARNGHAVKLDADYDLIHRGIVVIRKIRRACRNSALRHHLFPPAHAYVHGNELHVNGPWEPGDIIYSVFIVNGFLKIHANPWNAFSWPAQTSINRP